MSMPLRRQASRITDCDVCLFDAVSASAQAKLYPCGHHFCGVCWARLWTVGGRANCPVCTLEDSMALTDSSEMTAKLHALCELCRSEPWLNKCRDCKKNVCEGCSGLHHFSEAKSSRAQLAVQLKQLRLGAVQVQLMATNRRQQKQANTTGTDLELLQDVSGRYGQLVATIDKMGRKLF